MKNETCLGDAKLEQCMPRALELGPHEIESLREESPCGDDGKSWEFVDSGSFGRGVAAYEVKE